MNDSAIMSTGIDPISAAPGIQRTGVDPGIALTTDSTLPLLDGWSITGWPLVEPSTYSPYMPAPSADVLLHAKTRLAELDMEIGALDAKRAEAEMLRRMIAAAESP